MTHIISLTVDNIIIMSRLIILDIKGVLCTKCEDGEEEAIRLGSYSVKPKPHLKEFLSHLYENYKVAFFSSTTYGNAGKFLTQTLSKEQKDKTLFMWFRDRVKFDPEPEKDFDTIKVLDDFFQNPVYNRNKKWNIHNTIIIDDSARKLRFNDQKTSMVVDVEDDLLDLIHRL